MEIRELITFLSLSKTLNYQKTAAELQYAPSTLKKHISNLEAELRVPLFKREGRHIMITSEGEHFYEYARSLVDDYHKAVQSLSENKKDTPPLTVAGCEANLVSELDRVFQKYSVQHANVRLLKSMCSNSAVPHLVKYGLADLGIYYSLSSQPISGLESIFLYREKLHWMVYSDHPLAKKERVHYEDFANQSILTQHLDCCFINDGLRRIREKGVHSVNLLSVFFSSIQTIEESEIRTKCIRFRPHSALYSPTSFSLQLLDVEEEPCWVWNRIVVKPGALRDARVKELVQHFKDYANQQLMSEPQYYTQTLE